MKLCSESTIQSEETLLKREGYNFDEDADDPSTPALTDGKTKTRQSRTLPLISKKAADCFIRRKHVIRRVTVCFFSVFLFCNGSTFVWLTTLMQSITSRNNSNSVILSQWEYDGKNFSSHWDHADEDASHLSLHSKHTKNICRKNRKEQLERWSCFQSQNSWQKCQCNERQSSFPRKQTYKLTHFLKIRPKHHRCFLQWPADFWHPVGLWLR